MRPYLQNNQSKKGWRHESSSRVLAQQVQSPEIFFKKYDIMFIATLFRMPQTEIYPNAYKCKIVEYILP
jgi:hypothetical protein